MIYANPVPGAFASGQFYNDAGADYYLSPAKLESDYASVRFERELRLVRRHCGNGAILDVGCSSGAFLHQLRERFPGCYEILGNDVSGPVLEHAATRGIPVSRENFLESCFGGRTFDALTFWAVLEHVTQPRLFLRKASTLLKPGGFCFVLVPNMKSLAARLLGARYRYILPQHLNYFTAGTLSMLAGAEFSIVEGGSTHFNPLVIWQDWRGAGSEKSERERAELLQRTTSYKLNPWLKPARVLYQVSEKFLGFFQLADNLVLVLRKK